MTWQHHRATLVQGASVALIAQALVLSSAAIAQPAPTNASPPPSLSAVRAKVSRGIERIHAYPLNAQDHSPWALMHAIVAFGEDATVRATASTTEHVGAVDWLLGASAAAGEAPYYIDSPSGPRLPDRIDWLAGESHADQFLMGYALAGVAASRQGETRAANPFSIAHLVEDSCRRFSPTQELGWTLVTWSFYLASASIDCKDEQGAGYTVSDLLALSIRRDPRMETEAGSHHLYGVAFALAHGNVEVTETRDRAQAYLDNYTEAALSLQPSAGVFSTAGFHGSRAPASDWEFIFTTGHTFEWLSLAVAPKRLREPWALQAADGLADALLQLDLKTLGAGGKNYAEQYLGSTYHAVNALQQFLQLTAAPDELVPALQTARTP